jgi:hypothetical protein
MNDLRLILPFQRVLRVTCTQMFFEAALTDIASARQVFDKECLSFCFKHFTTAIRIESGKDSKGETGSELDVMLHGRTVRYKAMICNTLMLSAQAAVADHLCASFLV